MKPSEAAKKWAADHKNSAGVLWVLSGRPRGKGGRLGLQTARFKFYVRAGEAAQSHEKRKDRDGGRVNPSWNGLCHVCGEFYLQPVIKPFVVDEPQAGQPVPEDHTPLAREDGWQYLFSGTARVVACPKCQEAHGIKEMDTTNYAWRTWNGGRDDSLKITYVRRQHPFLTRYRDDQLFDLGEIHSDSVDSEKS